MRQPTRLEPGTRYVLAYCNECPPWRTLTGTRPAALRAAADHVELTHGNGRVARQLREQARRIEGRHADEP